MSLPGYMEDKESPTEGRSSGIKNQKGRRGAVFTQNLGNVLMVYDLTAPAAKENSEFVAYDLGVKANGYSKPTYVLKLDATAEDVGVFTDVTDDAIDGTTTAVVPFPATEAQYDALYICAESPIAGLRTDMKTQGVDGGTTDALWYYVSAVTNKFPSTWTEVGDGTAYTMEDNTDGAPTTGGLPFTAGTSTYTTEWIVPSDQVKAEINGKSGYWYKVMINTADYATNPELYNIDVIYPLNGLTIVHKPSAVSTLYLNDAGTASEAIDVGTNGKQIKDYDIGFIYITSNAQNDTHHIVIFSRK